MATTKTLTPTNQAITLAAFTEKPDNRTNVTNDDKLADAVNTLNSKLLQYASVSVTIPSSGANVSVSLPLGFTTTNCIVVSVEIVASGYGYYNNNTAVFPRFNKSSSSTFDLFYDTANYGRTVIVHLMKVS